jgi:TonB family protein
MASFSRRRLHTVTAFALGISAVALAAAQGAPSMAGVRLGHPETSMPSVRRQVLPELPAGAALAAREEVVIEVVVGANGRLENGRVVGTSPARRELERAAVDAVRQWEFRPAMARYEQGPHASLVLVAMTFEPRAGQPPRVEAAMRPVLRVPLQELDAASLPADLHASSTPGLRVPKVRRSIRPQYTLAAMRAIRQGVVLLDVVILADGTVGGARVTRSLDPDLDREALIAARYWLFEPAQLEGRAVATRAALELEFRLR